MGPSSGRQHRGENSLIKKGLEHRHGGEPIKERKKVCQADCGIATWCNVCPRLMGRGA